VDNAHHTGLPRRVYGCWVSGSPFALGCGNVEVVARGRGAFQPRLGRSRRPVRPRPTDGGFCSPPAGGTLGSHTLPSVATAPRRRRSVRVAQRLLGKQVCHETCHQRPKAGGRRATVRTLSLGESSQQLLSHLQAERLLHLHLLHTLSVPCPLVRISTGEQVFCG